MGNLCQIAKKMGGGGFQSPPQLSCVFIFIHTLYMSNERLQSSHLARKAFGIVRLLLFILVKELYFI